MININEKESNDFNTKYILEPINGGETIVAITSITDSKNGTFKFPVNNRDCKLVSVHRTTGFDIPDAIGELQEAFEGDTICISDGENDFSVRKEIVFKKGVMGIKLSDFEYRLVPGTAYDNEYPVTKYCDPKERFIPLAFLNLYGKSDNICLMIKKV